MGAEQSQIQEMQDLQESSLHRQPSIKRKVKRTETADFDFRIEIIREARSNCDDQDTKKCMYEKIPKTYDVKTLEKNENWKTKNIDLAWGTH